MTRAGGGGAVGARGTAGVPGLGAGCRFEEKSGMLALRPFRFMIALPADVGSSPLVTRVTIPVATSTR
jgi:hypothetical protein